MHERLRRTLTVGLSALLVVTLAWACEAAPPTASDIPLARLQ